ncbi:tyrosine-type recombinase/integrase [Brevibacterium ravenspurgense]|uniref:tyrosine-type recombinase/integrase n=1 Tax=Brevibacterium ravenspurgense TaxID=479117 RepID=UPI000784DA8C|nr:tyrosine-type recombinase/integrase [Brevibacterium ravenspurgense]
MFVGDFEEVGGFGDVIAEIGVLDEVVADVLAGAHDADEAELLTGGVVDAGVVVLAESIDIDDRPARHRGIPLNVLQKILGHKSIETTKGYLHPDLDHIAQAGDLTNRFLDAQTEGPERPSGKGRGKPKRGPDDRGL